LIVETNTEYKFNPFWVSIISLGTFYLIYKGLAYYTLPLISWDNFLRCIVDVLLAFLFLPLTFKLIFNIPALVLTKDCLKKNFGGKYSFEWHDIADIQLYSNTVGRSFAKLTINLKDPYKYFNTPLKKTLYKARQLFVANDTWIIVDFVAGDNEEIFEVIKAYWTRKVEH